MVARIANTFHTPLPQILAMPWDRVLVWWPEAIAVHAETFGRLRATP